MALMIWWREDDSGKRSLKVKEEVFNTELTILGSENVSRLISRSQLGQMAIYWWCSLRKGKLIRKITMKMALFYHVLY